MSLLAVDMGSSSCKAIAFSADGRALVQKARSYPPPESRHPSWAEMPAENFWRALVEVVQSIAAKVMHDPVEVLAISSHGETFVPVDSQGRAVAAAILNIDNRAVAEANWLSETVGKQRLFEITGQAPHPMYPAAKILWLRKHEPDVYASAACFVALPSYLLGRLGLPPYVDYSLASRFLTFDICQHAWSAEILSLCRLEPQQLPQPVAAGTVAGELLPDIAGQLGLRPGTMVVVGGHDQPCGALGSGVLESGRISASLGTYECLVAVSHAPVLNTRAYDFNLNSYCHVVPDRYVTLAYFPAGIMMEWFLRLIASPGELGAQEVGEVCVRLEAETCSGPSGLCIAPHLLGTCNPDFNPHASGVITGIRPTTSRADLYKGILEGIACEFALMSELLWNAAEAYQDVYVSGGGANSPLGLKLRAAISGRRLHVMKCQEAVCLGTAILAGVAAHQYRSVEEGVEQTVRVSKTIAPDAALAESYKAQVSQYRTLYSSLATLRRSQGTQN